MVRPVRTHAATLDDVAARAGVSRATASRVLAGSSKVSERAQQAVRDAAAELSYVARQAARELAGGRSDAIAFVVSETRERFFADPFFAGVLRGAQAAASDHRRQLMFAIVSTDDDRARFEEYAAGGHLGGAMFLSVHANEHLPGRLERLGIPVVLAGRPPGRRPALPFVSPDNVAGGRSAAHVLIERGCRHVATIAGPPDMTASGDRLLGFRAELTEHGVTLSDELVVAGDFSPDSGYEVARGLLARDPEIDGIFAANDLMALGALRALREAGRSVPDDVAVVGFDDVPLAAQAHPPLTTVRQPLEAMGRQMTRMLLDALDGVPVTSVTLATELVVRDSA